MNRDLAAAGIARQDEQGRIFDFHALRKTFVTHLKVVGVDSDLVRRLARHTSGCLTHTVYTDETHLPLRKSVERLARRDRRLRRKWKKGGGGGGASTAAGK